MVQSKLEIRTILDDVVHQFSSPLAFVRELVQNSIDAGTGEVEVEISREVHGDAELAMISFRDWGEGMTREIIDTKLLRLFSSGKDDDLTKIGRFGIGFVSVFAMAPEAVVVDTGREGEYWRIVFSRERSYELFALDEPIEGTEVRIYTPADVDSFGELKINIDHALREWCKYAEVPIRLDGRDIRQEMDVLSDLSMTYQEEGTKIVIGFSGHGQAISGYYNRGLTLKESVRSPWPWVTFKIDSRYLEHTLTRDQVLEDRHFSKAMALLEELAEKTLPERLITEIETLADSEAPGKDLETRYQYLAHYLSCDRQLPRSWRRKNIFRGPGGKTLASRQVRREHRRGRLYMTQIPGWSVEAIESGEVTIVIGGDGLRSLMAQLVDEAPGYIEEEYLSLVAIRAGCDEEAEDLRRAVMTVITGGDRQVDGILIAATGALPAAMRDEAAAVVPTDVGIIDRSRWRRPDGNDFADSLGPGYTLIVNAGSSLVAPFIALARREPEWAAVALVESLFAIGDEAIWSRGVNERATRISGANQEPEHAS